MTSIALATNVEADGTQTAVQPDPIIENTWRRTNTFLVFVDTDASTWAVSTITVWAEDVGGRTYKPGDSTELTPSGAGAVIVTIGDGHKLKVNVSNYGGSDDLYVYASPCRNA